MALSQGGGGGGSRKVSSSNNGRYPDLILQKGNQISEFSHTVVDTETEESSEGCCSSSSCKEKKFCSCARRERRNNDEASSKDQELDTEISKLEGLSKSKSSGQIYCARKWEYFPGKNKFYFDGRLMTAPSIRFCMLSFLLILVTFVLFTIFDGPFLAEKLTVAIPIIGSVLFIMVMVNMFKTTCSDPGILPRASAQESDFIEKSYATGNGLRPPPRTKDIVVNGQTIKSKYCFTCKMFRPPRASHCGVCDNCVDRFDHHCPFLGNCIGKRNYRNFYTFIVSLSLLAVFVLSCSITKLALLVKDKGNVLEALRDSPTSAIVILISFFGMWTVIGLAGFHTYLIAVEQTTNEDIKGIFGRSNSINPYTRGSVCDNCCFILCGPFQPSLIDSRGFVTPDFLSSLPKKNGGNETAASPRCSLPASAIRPPCAENPSTPRSNDQSFYNVTVTEPSIQAIGPPNAVITSSHYVNRSAINMPKAGTVPVESGAFSAPSDNSGLSFQPENSSGCRTKSYSTGFPDSSLSQSYMSNGCESLEIDSIEDMSHSMVHLDYPEYRSPPALRNGQQRKGMSTSVPLIDVYDAKSRRSRDISTGPPSSSGVGKESSNKNNLTNAPPPPPPPISAVDAPVALAFEDEVHNNLENLTMINSPLHLDSIS